MGEKVSFRQVGTERAGKLYKGVIMDAYSRMSQATIPSKFELVLAKQESPKDGFGHRASRFSLNSTMDIPGPGHYTTPADSKSPSYSKKGFLSAFVSSLKRFRPRDFATQVPGPGTYTPSHVRRSSNPATGLIPPKTGYRKRPEQRPEPCTYNPTSLDKPKVLTTSFQSKEERLLEPYLTAAPPPSYYDPKYTMVRCKSQGLTSPFKLPVHARRFQINLYDPHAQVMEDAVPGPGYYATEESFDKTQVNASFTHAGLDRFGAPVKTRKKKDDLPGPGSYNLGGKTIEKVPINGAVFMSESDRDAMKLGKNPGPAFYRPMQIAKKKSFHLNVERRWM